MMSRYKESAVRVLYHGRKSGLESGLDVGSGPHLLATKEQGAEA